MRDRRACVTRIRLRLDENRFGVPGLMGWKGGKEVGKRVCERGGRGGGGEGCVRGGGEGG